MCRKEESNCQLSHCFPRLLPGFQHLPVSRSGRSAFVIQAEVDEATIAVSQPSDCMALQRGDVVCSEIDVLDVWFGEKLTTKINGPTEPESPEVWQQAVHHLLNTYQPQYCYINTTSTDSGLGEEVQKDVEALKRYRGFWDENHHVLSFIRYDHIRFKTLLSYS